MRKICSSFRLALPYLGGTPAAAYAAVTLMSQSTRFVICLRTAHRCVTKGSALGWTPAWAAPYVEGFHGGATR
jgi:hypothetical protein